MGMFLGIMFLGWGDVLKPTAGTPEPIGFYTSGCINGAATLPLDGPGYQVMKPSRNRFFGHPSTLQFIQTLGSALQTVNSGILVGDLSQPRGGPMPSGHASHQLGLDVDVWFWTHPEQNQRSLSLEEREKLDSVVMLDAKGKVDPKKFTNEHITKLKLAALSPGVERIFVNPAIKAYLCSIIPESESAWLHALRPWAGHDEHFHVRLSCPKDSKECIPQAAQPPGNGCNELAQHFDPNMISDREEPAVGLPARCETVLKAEAGTNLETAIFKK